MKARSNACTECNGARYRVERRGAECVATACACSFPCRYCEGRGYISVIQESTFSKKVGARTYEVLAPCACRVLHTRIETYNRTGIPGVLHHATLETYTGSWPPEMQRAREVVTRFAKEFKESKRDRLRPGFVVAGPVGAGKTHLLASALRYLALESGVQTRYVEMSLLYATIRRGFKEGKSGGEIIGPLSEIDILAIDELGKGRGSPFELETLDELIARRYNAGRTTLFATNCSLLTPEEAQKGVSMTSKEPAGRGIAGEAKAGNARPIELLFEKIGARIYSRLSEMCEFVELPPNTPDHRRMRHELPGRGITRRAPSGASG